MSKKPRKKYNPNKNYDLVAGRCAKDILLVFVGGNEKACYPFDAKTGERIHRLEPKLHTALFEARLSWTYKLLAFLRDQNGNEYEAEMEVTAPHPVMHHQMMESLYQTHQDMIDETNPYHFVNLGYIASPVEISFDPVICRKIYDQMKAYEPLSTWEAEQQEKQKGDSDDPTDRTAPEDAGRPATCH